MRKYEVLKSVPGRVFTIYERSSQYGYWKQAVVTVFIGAIFSVGVLLVIFQYRGWIGPVVILGVIGVTTAYYRRKWFLSPSSLRLQTRLCLSSQQLRRVRERNTSQVVRNAIESRPFVGAVAAPTLCIMAYPVVTTLINRFLQDYSITSGVDETVWIVHATVTGFSFVILIFFWEFLGEEFDNEVFIRTAVRYTWTLHIIYFLLAANVMIGFLAILAQGTQVTSVVGLQIILFVLSILGVYWIYDTVYTVMVQETLTPRIKRRLEQQIGIILAEPDQETWMSVVNDQLNQDYPQLALPDFSGAQERVTAGDLGLSGEVTDIHLHRLHDLLDEASVLDADIEQLPELGQFYDPDDSIFVYQGDLTGQEAERLQNRLQRAFRVI